MNIINVIIFIFILNKNDGSSYPFLNSTQSLNNKKNVILGIIQKYSIDDILPFFKSLLKAQFHNCDIVMFVRNVSQILVDYLKSINVFVYQISEEYKNVSVINLRWKMYVDFLKEKKNEYNLVLSVDVRDTIFQKDVFKYYKNNTNFLGIAIEDDILNETINKNWIIKCLGPKKHESIMNERIICIGTFWGSLNKFLE